MASYRWNWPIGSRDVKNIFRTCQCIFTISLLSSLRKGHDTSFEHTWILWTRGYFGWNWSSGSWADENEMKIITTRIAYKGQIWSTSLRLRLAKKLLAYLCYFVIISLCRASEQFTFSLKDASSTKLSGGIGMTKTQLRHSYDLEPVLGFKMP